MPTCELCGRTEEKLLRVKVEGSVLAVCNACKKYGAVLGEAKTEERVKKILLPRGPRKKAGTEEEIEERVVADFSGRIRKAREKRGLKQKDFAKLLNEKESLVQKWEGGSLKPGLNAARKLERILKIKLVEKSEGEGEREKLETSSGKLREATLGDFVKVRKRKR